MQTHYEEEKRVRGWGVGGVLNMNVCLRESSLQLNRLISTGPFHNRSSDPLRITKTGVEGGRSIWWRHKDDSPSLGPPKPQAFTGPNTEVSNS